MKSFQQLAIIGSTASGKTALAIEKAQKMNAHILSLDSLALYKEIDIASAKPTKEEQQEIKHFGINLLYPNEPFDVSLFIDLYHKVYKRCLKEDKNLIIVGGTSFYLKMLLQGMSSLPTITLQTKEKTHYYLKNLEKSYALLYEKDKNYMQKIAPTDSYRIEKALHIYFQTTHTPTEYFKQHPPTPTIKEALPIYQITWDRAKLRERIALRTKAMLKNGLIDEVCYLEKKYTREPNAMKSIGIKEVLAYLDGFYTKTLLEEKIITNTARLAKRQNTFNNSQFHNVIRGDLNALKKI